MAQRLLNSEVDPFPCIHHSALCTTCFPYITLDRLTAPKSTGRMKLLQFREEEAIFTFLKKGVSSE
jgi:hypothetical protein